MSVELLQTGRTAENNPQMMTVCLDPTAAL